ncbi:MAG TPA: hypothetical protein VGS21_09720 [Acidimicrobiales bacterium]|nr:hypothetical protein [Acidimicrobiales bacterium]
MGPAGRFLVRVGAFALAGVVIGMPLDALHVETHVLSYSHPAIGVQAWWVPFVFAFAGIALCEGHHQTRRLIHEPPTGRPTTGLMVGSVGVLVAVYGSSGLLKSVPVVSCALYLLTFAAGTRLWWRESWGLLALTAIGLAIGGPLVESLITLTGGFHYADRDVWRVPVWLPLIYLNAAFVAATFDNLVDDVISTRATRPDGAVVSGSADPPSTAAVAP